MSRVGGIASLPQKASADAHRCSVLGTLALVGDFWSLGVIRSAVYGHRRFGDFERELGIATNVLTDRLRRLVDAGVFERSEYQSNPPRFEYELTAAGSELAPLIVGLKLWGDRHVQRDGAWTSVRHRGCSASLEVALLCPECGSRPGTDAVEISFLR